MTAVIASSPAPRVRVPEFRGAALDLMSCTDREVCLDGPAGTGKSFAALWKIHLRRLLIPGSRGLLARKTLVSLKASTLVTFRQKIQPERYGVRFWSAKGDEPAHYAYPNGSQLVIVGLDKPGKAMSTEYDDILIDEALDTDEEMAEALVTRIDRPGSLATVPYAQLIYVTNPGPPTHWLNQRMNIGRTTRLLSRHEDNPAMTTSYLATLANSLTGARRSRLLLGLWVAAEGAVYEEAWEPARHVLKRNTIASNPHSLYGNCGIDMHWPRYMGIDWGYRNPAVIKWYVKKPDGELVVYREMYQTMTLVEDLAKQALSYMGWRLSESGALLPTREDADPLPREIIADHDAEDRATFERHFGMSVYPANKGKDSINDGIQAVTRRLQDARLQYLDESLVQRDPLLEAEKKPCSSLDEFEAYIWDTRAGRPPKEQPIDANNHAMDVDRYVCLYFDRGAPDAGSIPFSAIGY